MQKQQENLLNYLENKRVFWLRLLNSGGSLTGDSTYNFGSLCINRVRGYLDLVDHMIISLV